jgi:hypothetical protein
MKLYFYCKSIISGDLSKIHYFMKTTCLKCIILDHYNLFLVETN